MHLHMEKNKETDVKYFIGYENNNKIKPLFNEVLQMIGYHNVYEEIHYMNFTINDKKLLEKYELIWNKIKNIIGNYFSTQPINMKKTFKS